MTHSLCFTLLLSRDINPNPGHMNTICNNILIQVFPFSNFNESNKTSETVSTDDQSIYDNSKWNNFQMKKLHLVASLYFASKKDIPESLF